jgi:hypothetical protein
MMQRVKISVSAKVNNRKTIPTLALQGIFWVAITLLLCLYKNFVQAEAAAFTLPESTSLTYK